MVKSGKLSHDHMNTDFEILFLKNVFLLHVFKCFLANVSVQESEPAYFPGFWGTPPVDCPAR